MSNPNTYEWQSKIFQDVSKGLKKGELFVIAQGRGTGKSMLAAKIKEKLAALASAEEWSEWRKTSSYIPRKSVYGKWIIGPMYERGKWVDAYDGGDFSGYTFTRRQRVRQYITKKELFHWRLANGNALHCKV